MKKLLILFLSCYTISTDAQQTISNWKHQKEVSSDPKNFVKAGKKTYFVATTPQQGQELWVTEGTTETTKLVKDIMVGENSSFVTPEGYSFADYNCLANAAPLEDGSLYFIASDNPNEKPKVWVTDGTEQGTKLYQNEVKGTLFYNEDELVQYTFVKEKNELTIFHKDPTKDRVIKLNTRYPTYETPFIGSTIKSKNFLTLSFNLGTDVAGPSYYVTVDLKNQKITAQTSNQGYYGSYFEQSVLWNNDVYLIMRTPFRYSNFQSVFRLNSSTGKCDTILTLPIKTEDPSLSLISTPNQLLLKSVNSIYNLQNDRFIPKNNPKFYKEAFGKNPFYDAKNDIMYTCTDSSYITSTLVNQKLQSTLFTNISIKGVQLSDGSLVKDVKLPTQANVGYDYYSVPYLLTPTKLIIGSYFKGQSIYKIVDINENKVKDFSYTINPNGYNNYGILQNDKVIFGGTPTQQTLDNELYSLDIRTDEVKLLKNINLTGNQSSNIFTTTFESKSVQVYSSEKGIMLSVSDGTRSGTKDIELLYKNSDAGEVRYVDFKEMNGRLGLLITKRTQTSYDSTFLFSMDKKLENIKLLFSAIGKPSYSSDQVRFEEIKDNPNRAYVHTNGYNYARTCITDFTLEGTLNFDTKEYSYAYVKMANDKYLFIDVNSYDIYSVLPREKYLLRYDLKSYKVDTISKNEDTYGFLRFDDKNYAFSLKLNKWYVTDGLNFTELQGVKMLSRTLKIKNKTYFIEDYDRSYFTQNKSGQNSSYNYSIFQLENNVSKPLFSISPMLQNYQSISEKIWEINGKTFFILSISPEYGSTKSKLQIFEIKDDLSFENVRQIDDDKTTLSNGIILNKGLVYTEIQKDETVFYVMKDDLIPVEIYRANKNTKFIARVLETNQRIVYIMSNGSLLVTDGTKGGSKLLINNNLIIDDIEKFVLFSEYVNSDKVKGELYFSFEMPKSYGINLWKTDGTEAGTIQLFKKSPKPNSGNFEVIKFIGKIKNQSFFSIKNDANGQDEIWTTEGTLASTKPLLDVNGDILLKPTTYYYDPKSWQKFTKINDKLYFSRQTIKNGYEPWETDGTASGTKMIGDLVKGIQGSNPYQFVEINQTPYCIATEENKALQLWSFCNPKVFLDIEKIAQIYNEEVKLLATQNSDWKYQWLKDGKALDKANNTTYIVNSSGTYQIKIEDKIGCTSLSDSIVIKFAQKILANEELKLTDEFNLKIFPNPAQNDLNITFEGKNNAKFQLNLYDLTGKLLLIQEVETIISNNVPTQNLNAGIYFIRLTDGEKQIIRKIIKQ